MTATLPGLNFRRTARARAPADRELVVDVFAGAGGATLGIEAALERAVDLRINHAELALRIGRVNHPMSRHLASDVWEVDPVEACGGRPVGLAWFSPDCTHFSRAKGGRPRRQKIRSLAWVVVRWAKAVRPRVIILENVPEFATWGPLDAEGYPVAEHAGRTFRQWIGRLRGLGYAVEWRELVAADYGVPTIRRRLFLVARCDGRPIRWPARTHAPRGKAEALGLAPWRAAAECIDWSLPCPSIFERRRPLAEATQRRIAMGLRKFVLEAESPFVVCCNHGGPEFRGQSPADPLCTLTASRDAHGLVVPQVLGIDHQTSRSGSAWNAGDPLRTVTQENRFALVESHLQRFRFGEARHVDLREPMQTLCAQGNHHALVEAFLAKYFSGCPGQSAAAPLGAVTVVDHHALAQVWCQANNTANAPRAAGEPLGTVTTGGRQMLAAAFVDKMYGRCRQGQDSGEPLGTITGTHNHLAHVQAFLVKYFSQGGQHGDARDPLATITAKHRLGLVTVHGVDYQLIDIGLRMLQPAELLRAQFGRFAEDFVLVGNKTEQVAAIGNSVCPEVAEALVRANVKDEEV